MNYLAAFVFAAVSSAAWEVSELLGDQESYYSAMIAAKAARQATQAARAYGWPS